MSAPKEDAEILMNDLLPLAKKMLTEEGEFYPYGGFMRHDGSIVHVGAQIKGTDYPDSKSLIDLLVSRFRHDAKASKHKATAIIFDVRVIPPGKSEKTDAIQANLDHQSGYSAEVFFPYVIEADRKLRVGTIFAQRGSNKIYDNMK